MLSLPSVTTIKPNLPVRISIKEQVASTPLVRKPLKEEKVSYNYQRVYFDFLKFFHCSGINENDLSNMVCLKKTLTRPKTL